MVLTCPKNFTLYANLVTAPALRVKLVGPTPASLATLATTYSSGITGTNMGHVGTATSPVPPTCAWVSPLTSAPIAKHHSLSGLQARLAPIAVVSVTKAALTMRALDLWTPTAPHVYPH